RFWLLAISCRVFSPTLLHLEQPEAHLNWYRGPHGLAARPASCLAAPCPYCLDRLFVQSQPGALHHAQIRYAVVDLDNRFHDDDTLILRFPRLFRVRRIGMVIASWPSHAVHASAKRAAARASAFARAKSSAGSTANASTVSVPERVGISVRQWIAEGR